MEFEFDILRGAECDQMSKEELEDLFSPRHRNNQAVQYANGRLDVNPFRMEDSQMNTTESTNGIEALSTPGV